MADRSHKIPLFSRYLEGGLSLTERQAVEVHFRVCAVCRQELTWLCQTVDALQELPLETTPVDFMEKLNRRIEREGSRAACSTPRCALTRLRWQVMRYQTPSLRPQGWVSRCVPS